MPLIKARILLDALKSALVAIPLSEETADEPLFEAIELYKNKALGDALVDLTLTKGRVCLVVPTGIRRVQNDSDQSGAPLILRYLEVDLLIADRSYYKASQVAIFGGDKNLGVLAMGEAVEQGIAEVDLSAWGPAIFGDGAAQEVSGSAEKMQPGREAWIQTLLIPAGDNR